MSTTEPFFRLIIDDLTQSKECKERALLHVERMREVILRTVKWDMRFIYELASVEQPPDSLDEGIAKIAEQFGQRRPANDNGGQS